MKELNTSTEAQNRYKFQSFRVRVDNLKIDVTRRVKRVPDQEPEGQSSFFKDAFDSWKELNLTVHFVAFAREVSPYCQTLPQLVYHKERIVEILERHLGIQESLAYEPLLDLITKFARDLEGDFYQYFERIFAAIVLLTKYEDARILEWTFNCITYLFKYLSKEIIVDLRKAYRLLAPLLGEENQKPYIRHFAAEAFAFLLRKARGEGLTDIVIFMLESLKARPTFNYCEGLSMLFFEAIKTVNRGIHSRGLDLLKELVFSVYIDLRTNILDIESNVTYCVLKQTIVAIIRHSNQDLFKLVLELFLEELKNQFLDLNTATTQDKSRILPEIAVSLSLIYICVTARDGSCVADFDRIFLELRDFIPQLLQSFSSSETAVPKQIFKLIASMLILSGYNNIFTSAKTILNQIFECPNVVDVLSFSLLLARLNQEDYTRIILPYLARYASTHWNACPNKIILFFAHLLSTGAVNISESNISPVVSKKNFIQSPKVLINGHEQNVSDYVLNLLNNDYDWVNEAQKLSWIDVETRVEEPPQLCLIASALTIVPYIESPYQPKIKTLTNLIRSLTESLRATKSSLLLPLLKRPFTQGSPLVVLQNLLGMTIEALTNVCQDIGKEGTGALTKLWDTIFNDVLMEYGRNGIILRATMAYFTLLRKSASYGSRFAVSNFEKIYSKLKQNINSFRHHNRLYTLKILNLFDHCSTKQDRNSKKSVETDRCEIFSMALAVEETEVSLESYREKLMHLRKLINLYSTKHIPKFYSEVIIRVCLGFLTLNFSPLWSEAIKMLTRMSNVDGATLWKIIYEEISRFDDQIYFAEDTFSPKVLAHYLEEKIQKPSQNIKTTSGLSFECPHLNKYNKIFEDSEEFIGKGFNNSLVTHFISVCSPQGERFDHWNYYGLLIKTLTEIPHLAEEHSLHIIPSFLQFVNLDFDGDMQKVDSDTKNANEMDVDSSEENAIILQRSARLSKINVSLYLQLFAKFKHPDRIKHTTNFKSIYLQMLTNGDPQIQSLALDCLLTWKLKNVTPYEENLRSLVDEGKFRGELARFSLGSRDGVIKTAHRNDIMPIVIRILYGKMVSKKVKGPSTGMSARRIAVMTALANCNFAELRLLMDLLLEPFSFIRRQPCIVNDQFKFTDEFDVAQLVPYRKQIGYLNLLAVAIKQLESRLAPFIPDLLSVVMYIIHDVNRKLIVTNESDKIQLGGANQLLKNIRQTGLKCLSALFKVRENFDYQPYINAMFESFISPRIPVLNIENTQAPSALLELFSVWASRKEYISFLVDYNKDVLPKVFACLSAKKVQESVFALILDITDNILQICDEEPDIDIVKSPLTNKVLLPHMPSLLENLGYSLSKPSESSSFSKDIFAKREISILSHVAAYVTDSEQALKLIELLFPSLRKSSRIIPDKTKFDILCIVMNFLNIIPEFAPGSEIFIHYYELISVLFSTLSSRDCRKMLVVILRQFAVRNQSLREVVEIVEGLNSFSVKKLDVPDFERRLNSFNLINSRLYKQMTSEQWLPLLHNCLYFARDPEEVSIRNNASLCLTRFIDHYVEVDAADAVEKEKLQRLLIRVIYLGIKMGIKSKLESVRSEFITILAHAVKRCPTLPQFSDMNCLMGNDDEASFFSNIYHIQIHRRVRALIRFSNECKAGRLRNTTLIQIFLPLISNFISEADQITDHNLINKAVTTIGVIAGQLPWGKYYDLLKQYLRLIPRKSDLEKVLVRVVIAILDNFHFNLSNVRVVEPLPQTRIDNMVQEKNIMSTEETESGEQLSIEIAEIEPLHASDQIISLKDVDNTIPLVDRIHETVVRQLIPELNQYLTQSSNECVAIRVPVALAIVKLLMALPGSSLRSSLPGLLTTVCQTLRARSQDVRDTTRATLVNITKILGPKYFSYIINELRAALTKGYQLHVLGYTLHSLLVPLVPMLQVGDIDYCLTEVTDIMFNDIFGEVGHEKDIEEITKMRETKSSKSYDSLELVSRVIKFGNIGTLLLPLRDIMKGTQSLKILNKVDHILHRLSAALNSNPKLEIDEMLSFCQGLVSQNLQLLQLTKKPKGTNSKLEENYAIQTNRHVEQASEDYLSVNAHRFVEFGLTIFLTALKQEKFDLKSPEHLQHLDSFVNVVRDAMFSKYTRIVILATKVMCIMCRLPLPSMSDAFPLLVKQTFKFFESSSNTSSELVQSYFRFLVILIRDCKQVEIKEIQLKRLIDLIRPDLEVPEKQAVTFSLIRAIISRKFVVPEIYDLMQSVAEIMITSQGTQIREQCRNIYFIFLLDYPQGPTRLKNQINFLVKNLDYKHESGRESVMLLLESILLKFPDQIVTEYVELLFFSLVMSLINDEAQKCRKKASTLIKRLLQKMLPQRTKNIIDKWFDKTEKKNLQRAAVQVYGLLIEAFGQSFAPFVPDLLKQLEFLLISSRNIMKDLEETNGDDMAIDIDWEVGYYALSTFAKLVKEFPTFLYSEQTRFIWELVKEHISHPHTWIRSLTCRLFGQYFANIDSFTKTNDYLTSNTLRDLASKFSLQLESEVLSSQLASQIVKNLFFIGKCFYGMSRNANVISNLKENHSTEGGNEVGKSSADSFAPKMNGLNGSGKSLQGNGQHQDPDSEPEVDEFLLDKTVGQQSNLLLWLFNKLSFQARKEPLRNSVMIQRSSIYQWFAAMTSIMSPTDLTSGYLMLIISPIYRLVNDETNKTEGIDKLKHLGQEVLDLLRSRVGTTEYHRTYNKIRQLVVQIRRERKNKEVIQATVNPDMAARRKQQKSGMKRERNADTNSRRSGKKHKLGDN